jgi:hypothetical protein
MPPPPQPTTPLTEERRNFLSSLLDICVRQLAWPDDAEWEAPGGEDPDPDDDMAKFWTLRMVNWPSAMIASADATVLFESHRINIGTGQDSSHANRRKHCRLYPYCSAEWRPLGDLLATS